MSDKKEDDDNGISALAGAAAVAGGVAAGGGASKMMVDRSLNANLGDPYAEGIKEYGAAHKAAELFEHNLTTEKDLQNRAEAVLNLARHEADRKVRASTAEPVKSLFTKDTMIGDAAQRARDAAKTTAGAAEMETRGKAMYDKLGAAAKGLVGKEEAAETMLKAALAEAEAFDRVNISQKVKQVSWLSRINPLSSELHLSGKQKGFAIAAGTVTAAISAIGLAKLASWMGGSKEQDSGPSK